MINNIYVSIDSSPKYLFKSVDVLKHLIQCMICLTDEQNRLLCSQMLVSDQQLRYQYTNKSFPSALETDCARKFQI